MSGFLTLSPIVPTVPVTPSSPFEDKFITRHIKRKQLNIIRIFLERSYVSVVFIYLKSFWPNLPRKSFSAHSTLKQDVE